MKKILFLIVLVACCFKGNAQEFLIDGIYYTVTSVSNATVSANLQKAYYFNEADDRTVINVPEDVVFEGKKYTVNIIAGYSHGLEGTNITNITKITLPNTVKTLGSNAFFGFSSLKEINLNYVEYLGTDIFNGCKSITEIVIPTSVKEVYSSAFNGSNLKAIIMQNPTPPAVIGELKITNYYNGEIVVPIKSKYQGTYWGRNFVEMCTPANNTFQYSGKLPDPSFTNNMKAYNMTVSNETLVKDAGTHTTNLNISFKPISEEDMSPIFTIEYPYEYIISKAPLNVTVNNTSREYGEENPKFTCLYDGLVNNETSVEIGGEPKLTTTATKSSNVGTYPIDASIISQNYEPNVKKGELTVTRANVTGKIEDVTKEYGDYKPSFNVKYTGLKNGQETIADFVTQPKIQTDATLYSPVGEYPITADNTCSTNYNVSFLPGKLIITPATLKIKATSLKKTYKEDNPKYMYSISGKKNYSDELTTEPSFICNATKVSKVGVYAIKPYGAVAQNYDIKYEEGTLEIEKRSIVVKAKDEIRKYGEDNPMFSVVYTGFADEENEDAISVKPSIYCNADTNSDTGEYEIIPSDAKAENYSFIYKNGTLSITKAEQSIKWEQDFNNIVIGDQIELDAKASSNLDIQYTSSNERIASVYQIGDNFYLDCKEAGTIILKAEQNGNINYYPTVKETRTITISNPTGISEVLTDRKDIENCYNIQGLKVVTAKSKGIYIKNGKKYVIK